MTKIINTIKAFFSTTKLGKAIKSGAVTFTALFFGILFLNPVINSFLSLDLPTIQQLKDIVPVLIDTFYRAIWAVALLQIGVYRYNSSEVEKAKPAIIPITK
jgi:hypothetical protein